MTREEAIYRLKNMAWLYGSAEREQNIEAIDMAIDALRADRISRTELFNKLATVNAPMEANAYKAEVYRIINEL